MSNATKPQDQISLAAQLLLDTGFNVYKKGESGKPALGGDWLIDHAATWTRNLKDFEQGNFTPKTRTDVMYLVGVMPLDNPKGPLSDPRARAKALLDAHLPRTPETDALYLEVAGKPRDAVTTQGEKNTPTERLMDAAGKPAPHVEALVKMGAEIRTPPTPIELLSGADVSITTNPDLQGQTPLHQAALTGPTAAIEAVTERGQTLATGGGLKNVGRGGTARGQ